jgi:hypothetical protein
MPLVEEFIAQRPPWIDGGPWGGTNNVEDTGLRGLVAARRNRLILH